MLYDNILNSLNKIKALRPLIVNITNEVTPDFIANGLLSVGASPLMTKAEQELEELVRISQAIVINLGTLEAEFVKRAEKICFLANQYAKPIILDPVGAGASQYRTKSSLNLLDKFQFDIIRGNASEIMALASAHGQGNTKGVDTSLDSKETIEQASLLSERSNTVIAISGRADIVIAKEQLKVFEYGSPLMPQITGTGCLLTALIAAFRAIHEDAFIATCAAIVFFTVCGEQAALKASGPGTFKPLFLDQLSFLPKRENYASI